MRPAAWDAWVAKARSVRIEDECSRRGIVFNGQAGKTERCGPCPKCGGEDRFAVNTKKQVFNCRGCSARGDVIAFVQFLDDSDFAHAVEALTGEPPPKRTAKLTAGIRRPSLLPSIGITTQMARSPSSSSASSIKMQMGPSL